MDNEAEERKRQQDAARARAYRRRKKDLKGGPHKTRGGQPTDNPHRQRGVYLTDAEWAFCKAQPGSGSEFVRQLVAAYIAANGMPEWLTKGDSGEAGGTEYLTHLIAIGHALEEAKALLANPDGKDLVAAILEGYRNGRSEA